MRSSRGGPTRRRGLKHGWRKLAAFVDVGGGWRVRRRRGVRAALGGARGRGCGRRLEHGASRGRCRGVGGGIRAAGVPVRVVPRGRERGGRRGDGPGRVAHRRAGLGGRGRLLRGGLSGRRRLRDANEPRALRLAESALDPRRKVHGRACGEGRVVVKRRCPRFGIRGSRGGVSRVGGGRAPAEVDFSDSYSSSSCRSSRGSISTAAAAALGPMASRCGRCANSK